MNIFGGMKILWIFWGGYHIVGLYLRVIFMHLGSYHSIKVHNGGYFWGLLKFQFFGGT